MSELFLQLFLSIILVAALVVMNFSLFRIPIYGNHVQITLLAVTVGTTNFYSKFIIHSSIYMLVQLCVYIVLLAFIRRYPILYAFAVCGIGSIVATMCDAITTFGAQFIGLSSNDLMANDIVHFTFFHLLSTAFYLIVAYLIKRFDLGFYFVIKRFDGKHMMKTHNYVWIFLAIIGTSIIQVINDSIKFTSLHGLLITGVTFIFCFAVGFAIIQNRRVMRDRFLHNGGDRFGKPSGK